MPAALDHVADKGGVELVRLAKLYSFPDFVKSASLSDATGARSLPATVYADPVRRQYPCDTAASTWLSALFFQEKQAEFHPKDRSKINERLTKMVNYWGIKAAVDTLRGRWEELYKDADAKLPDSAYGYVWVDDESGRKERNLPLRSAAEVKAAAEWLEQYRDRLPYAHRQKIATKILEKAAHHGAGIHSHLDFLERQAGRGICNPTEVVEMLENRSLLAKNASQRDMIRELAKTVKTSPRQALQPIMLTKLAETVDMMDRTLLGVVGHYSDKVPRPEDVIFSVTFTKGAADHHAHVSTATGKVYPKEQLAKVAMADLEAMFGPEFLQRVTSNGTVDVEKMATEMQTLPRPDMQMLDTLLSDQGITPVAVKAASARRGFSAAQLTELANAYADV